MKNSIPASLGLGFLLVLGLIGLGTAWPTLGAAQEKATDHSKHTHPDNQKDSGTDQAERIRDLRAKVAKLEAVLKQGHQGASGKPGMGSKGGPGMGMMGGQKMGMGMMGMGSMEGMKPDEMMGQMMQNMGQMMQMMGQMQRGKGMSSTSGTGDKQKMSMGMMGGSQKGMGGMGMMGMEMSEMMGRMGTGNMGQDGIKGVRGMQMSSELPGFPGASHIYHIGATGFFIDHPEHVKLTTQQQTTLNNLKEKALLEKSTSQRKIDEAEQELWTLTASDQPDATKIGDKVHEIEKLRGDLRLAFIRAVGEAARMLSDDQRHELLGTTTGKPGTHAGH
jgi:hypothetical protein